MIKVVMMESDVRKWEEGLPQLVFGPVCIQRLSRDEYVCYYLETSSPLFMLPVYIVLIGGDLLSQSYKQTVTVKLHESYASVPFPV